MKRRTAGSLLGAVGGLVFVLVNAGALPGAWALRTAAVGVLVAVVVAGRRPTVDVAPPPRSAVRTYGWCVILMVVAIVLGARLLALLDSSDLTLPWVVGVVGLHFWPFARAFAAPVFARLAVALVVVALAGAAAVLADVGDAAPATGVAAGFVLLAAALAGEVTAPVPATAGGPR
ncbi:hypothetical protein [Nocardioides sp. Arc9.136]|uniref:hypothetical protein n=1 Tax=Nocardioides sp. Arc9.136 TaxID=2996826 RepID=UPI0026656148|nr:hypothetical protein [Nocardioides sp. Arc9.136]WKN47451.1 hypothetical protein OSR43_15595 [Nocardioides sp. Arc9.136]